MCSVWCVVCTGSVCCVVCTPQCKKEVSRSVVELLLPWLGKKMRAGSRRFKVYVWQYKTRVRHSERCTVLLKVRAAVQEGGTLLQCKREVRQSAGGTPQSTTDGSERNTLCLDSVF